MKPSRNNKKILLVFAAAMASGCICSCSPTPEPEHVHTYSSTLESDENGHFYRATCEHSDLKKYEDHIFDNPIVQTTPAETTYDIKKQVCSVCGYEKEIERTPHTHSYGEWVDTVAATEETEGSKERICSTCGYKQTETTEKIHRHSFGNWVVDSESTAKTTGLMHRICSTCSEREELTIPKIDSGYAVKDYYSGYYSPIIYWENGEDLKNQLHNLIRTGYTGLVYEGNWETNQMAEQSLTNFQNVNVVYSQNEDKKVNTYGSSYAGATGWQREHAFCASLMTAYNTSEAVAIASKGTGRATDFHNLFAAYGAANGARGNKNFGNYDPSKESTSNAQYADTHADTLNYEPNDCDKGRLARAIFYMGVMYNEDENSTLGLSYKFKDSNNTSRSKTINVNAKYKPLQIVEDYVNYSQITFTNFVSSTDADAQEMRNKYLTPYRSDTSAFVYTTVGGETSEEKANSAPTFEAFAKAYSDYRYNEGKFSIGNLSTLLTWSTLPVDRQEMWHNQVVYSYVHKEGNNKDKKQGNRNPFVDYPDLVDYIYGSKKDESGWLMDLRPSEDVLETNSEELYNYALTSYKDKYFVDDYVKRFDYEFVRVNKDFSTEAPDFEDQNEPIVFRENDIGKQTITLNTPTGSVSYEVTVESRTGVNACNYNFMINKSSFNESTVTIEPKMSLSYGGINYYVSATNNNASVTKNQNHIKIGAEGSDKCAGKVIIESEKDFTYDDKININGVYIGLNSASGTTYNYKISIGDEEVLSGTFTYNSEGATIYGGDLPEPKSGKLKIELSNCTKAVYISQISVNVN